MKPHLTALGSLCLLLTLGCGPLFDANRPDRPIREVDCDCTPLPRDSLVSELRLEAKTYPTCDALRQDLNIIRNRRKTLEESFQSTMRESRAVSAPSQSSSRGPASGAASAGSAKDSAQGSDVLTNLQEAGVDEADIYKVSANHIFALVEGELHVASRHSMGVLGKMPIDAKHEPQMFVWEDNLVVVDALAEPPLPQEGNAAPAGSMSLLTSMAPRGRMSSFPHQPVFHKTRVRTFALVKDALPALKETQTLDGAVSHTRLVEGKLVVVLKGDLEQEPLSVVSESTLKGVACDDVHTPAVHNMNQSFTRVSMLDVTNLSRASEDKAFLGAGEFVYMSPSAIYVSSALRAWDYFLPAQGKPRPIEHHEERVVVHRIAFDAKAGLGQVSLGSVKGRVKDEWSFKQGGDDGRYLHVATTTGELWRQGPRAASNHLTVLETKGATMRTVGQVSGFGRNEDIRSIRYVGNTAYVVTFKKTDPLFAIDISNPQKPTILGELKIPGFSTYMHPVGENRLVGIGFETEEQGDFALFQGIQFSLFDVSNAKTPKRLDVKVHGGRGSSSEATTNHHAFFFDADSGTVAFPVVELKNHSTPSNGSSAYEGSTLLFSGAVFYDVTGDTLKEIARVSHAEWIPAACKAAMGYEQWWQGQRASFDVGRIFQVDGKTLTLSPFGLKAWAQNLNSRATQAAKWQGASTQICNRS